VNTSKQDITHKSRFNAILGNAAFLIIVLGGLFSVLLGLDDASPAQVAGLCLLVLLYALIGLFIYPRIETSQSAPALVAYFAVQLMLGLFLCVLGNVISRGQGAIWLVLLPMVGQAVISLQARGALLVAALSIVAYFFSLWVLYQRVDASVALLCVAGMMFAFFFTQSAVRERRMCAQLEKLAGELRQSNRTLSEYGPQVEALAATRERYQQARDSNEAIGKLLSGVNAQIEIARAAVNSDAARLIEALTHAQSLAREGLVKSRYSAAALRATPMDKRNLIDAIDVLVDETRESGLNVNLAVSGTTRALPAQIERALYRATQESLSNIRLHTEATRVGVLLTFDTRCARLTVRDDGTSAADTTSDDVGIAQLREQVELLGGTLRTHNAGGFVLEVEIPA
jgi:signal transduction histidine kinase